jgi:hypothetical protein
MGRLQDRITLDSLAAVTASRNSGVFDLSGYTSGAIYWNFTAVSGTTPSLTALLQCSVDGFTTVATVPAGLIAAPAAFTAGGLVVTPFLIPIALGQCRLNYVITGTTPSFTGTIVGVFNHP